MKLINTSKPVKVLFGLLVLFFSVLAPLFPVRVYAADIAYEDSVQYAILEYCADNDSGNPSCVDDFWGGAQNRIQIEGDCQFEDEPERCTQNKLLAIDKVREQFGDSNNGGSSGGDGSFCVWGLGSDCDSAPESYPNTKCFTVVGGEFQEQLCPRSATYPGGNPPDSNKCYASNLTSETGGNLLFEESSCDTSTFTGAADDGSDDDSTATDNNPSCETTGNPLSWILCPLINGIAEVADFMFEQIVQPLLVARNLDYIQPGSEMYQVWSSFRVIANILLIIVLLVIVFGQAIGGGLIDAYTAKKALPRVFAAAILINLSIYLVAFALDVTNIIGAGLSNIIYAPFQGAGEFKIQLGNTSSILAYVGIGGGIWAAVAAGGALLQVIPVILLFVVVPAVLAFLAVVVTLVLRQGIIILLILISPVAFLAFVLPNTEQYFKKWWDLLLKTLLVYPIVMVIFAISDVLAAVLSGSFPFAVQWVADLVSILLLVLPLFLIPFSFKLAGGAIGQIFGALDGFGKKGGELLKGSERDPASMRNRYRYKARSALNDKNMSGAALGTRVNPFIGLGKGGLKGYRERRGARLTAQRSNMQAILGEDAAGGAFFKQESMDDKPMYDLAMFSSGAESRNWIDRKTAEKMAEAGDDAEKIAEVNNWRQQRLVASAAADRIGRTSANRRKALMQGSTIAYGLADGSEGWYQAMDAMKDISGGDDAQFKHMVNEFQYQAKGAGRADLSGNTDSGEYDGDRAWKSVGLYQQSNGKPASIKGSGKHFLDKFQSNQPILSDDSETLSAKASARDDAAVFYKELEAMLPNSTGGVRDQIVEQMQALDAAGMKDYLNQSMGKRKVAVRDDSDPNNFVWKEQDVTRGQLLSSGQIEGKRVRAYERPDPNRLNEES